MTGLLPVFSSMYFVVSYSVGHTFKSFICFQLIFLCGTRRCGLYMQQLLLHYLTFATCIDPEANMLREISQKENK